MSFDLREWQVKPGNWNRLNEILGLLGVQEIPKLKITTGGVLSRGTDVTSDTYGEIVLNYDLDQFEESPAGTFHLQHFDMSGSTIIADEQIEILSTTTPQLKLSYDGSNNATWAVGSGGDLTIAASGGDISFGNENLLTTGTLGAGVATLASGSTIGNLTLADGSITDSGGTINFDNENLITTGTLGAGIATLATGSTIGTLTLADGSITDSGGSISFDNENLTTTGTITAGELILPNTNTWKIGDDVTSGFLCIENDTTGTHSIVRQYAKDGDGTDFVAYEFFGKGTRDSIATSHFMVTGWLPNGYYIMATVQVNDSLKDIRIYTGSNTDQLVIAADGKVGIQNSSPTYTLDITGSIRTTNGGRLGSGSNYMDVSSAGDVLFYGASGLVYGEISAYNSGATITIAASGIGNKVQITAFDTDGFSHNLAPDHTNDHITVGTAGHYLCIVSISAESAGAGGADEFGFAVYKNNGATLFQNCHSHRRVGGGGGDTGSISISGIIDLAVFDTIEVWCWNEDSGDDIVIDDITLSLIQLGGT